MEGSGEVEVACGSFGVHPRPESAGCCDEIAHPRIRGQTKDSRVGDGSHDLDDEDPTTDTTDTAADRPATGIETG